MLGASASAATRRQINRQARFVLCQKGPGLPGHHLHSGLADICPNPDDQIHPSVALPLLLPLLDFCRDSPSGEKDALTRGGREGFRERAQTLIPPLAAYLAEDLRGMEQHDAVSSVARI